jgi:hypothetical protein
MFNLLSCWVCAGCFSLGQPSEELFVARPLTAEGSFTRGIEGPACDAAGNVYAVNYQREHTIGIEVSPDGKMLYVNESRQRKVWAFRIEPDGSLAAKQLLIEFPDHGMDGMRCDVDGNLYITRQGKGTVVKLSPQGDVLREIGVLGAHPSNLCFGGPDGRTAYVTEVDRKRIVQFRVDRPGLSWKRWQEAIRAR